MWMQRRTIYVTAFWLALLSFCFYAAVVKNYFDDRESLLKRQIGLLTGQDNNIIKENTDAHELRQGEELLDGDNDDNENEEEEEEGAISEEPHDAQVAENEGQVERSLEADSEQIPDMTVSPSTPRRWNVLLIMADDMRPQISPYYGEDFPTPSNQMRMITPNFEQLARESIVFRRAFVQYSLCGPSRTSLLTSRRPDTTRVFGNGHYWRTTGGNFTTLPQYFKENGYVTIGAGKVFHPGHSSNNSDPISWTEPLFSEYRDGVYEDESRLPGWHAVTDDELAKVPLTDQLALSYIRDRLRAYAPDAITGKQPIFFAIGFRKPHISLNCPKKYFDLYPLESDYQFPSNRSWQTPKVSFRMINTTWENRTYRINEAALRHFRRAYFACISYVDDLLGQLLDEVDRLELTNNTIVAFIADHGYHLGENDHWGKYIIHELANHVPFMIRIPGRTQPGYQTRSIVEAVDLFPTLAELAGLDSLPRCPPQGSSGVPACTEGISLVPLIERKVSSLKEVALSQVLRGDRFMEYSIRTDRYRYVELGDVENEKQPDGSYAVRISWELPEAGRYLFDHVNDPEETTNLAYDQEYQDVVDDLRAKLHSSFKDVYQVPVAIPAHSKIKT